MRTSTTGLSKSRILDGLQCEKRLWLERFRPNAAEQDPSREAVFAAGHEVGEVARVLYGPGHLGGEGGDLRAALAETQARLAAPGKRATLFEATFQHDAVLVRVDVLKPVRGGYDLIEVKSSTSVHDYHLQDCAVQAWVLRRAGIPVRRVVVAHINNEFVYQGNRDYRGLLKEVNVTANVEPLVRKIPAWVKTLRGVLAGREPDIRTGAQCNAPYPCPFQDYCRSQEPSLPKYPVDILPRGGKLIEQLRTEGYIDLRRVPAERLVNALHQRVRKASITGKPFMDPAAGEAVRGIPYPRYYVDFETVNFAVPRWAGTRPYQQIPFQWSCHVEARRGSLNAAMFLDLTGAAPMRAFAESLLDCLGRDGPILVYNQAFEATRIRELADMLPKFAPRLLALVPRIVDLLPITRAHYYHPAMQGSWSIKKVIPTIAPELDYEELGEVNNSGAAPLAYLEAVDAGTAPKRRRELETGLRTYCANDTLAMVRLAKALSGG